MKTMRIVLLIGSALLAAAVAGCGGGSAAPIAPPALSGQAALDAEATLAVWSAQGTAVVAETRRVEQVTVDAAAAIAQATQAAQAAAAAQGTAVAAEATATAGAYQAAATSQAIAATATADTLAARQWEMGIIATATADAAALAFQEAQGAKALAAKQAEIDREALWTRMTPWIVGAAVALVGGLLLIGAAVLAVERMRRTRPVKAGDVWVMIGPGGQPMRLNQPQLTAGRQLPPAPITVSKPEPIPLPALRRGHVLIAGETGSGKSTAMRAVLAARRDAVVLDPHWDGRNWDAAEVIGGGRDFEAIGEFMQRMDELLKNRYRALHNGRTEFEPLTVAVDEMPAIVGALGRQVEATWRSWLREGRKVGLLLVLSTQSTRVRTLGIEGERDLLENFAFVLALGDAARREYPHVVEGMARPAALVTSGTARPVIIPDRSEPAAARPAQPAAVVAVPAGDLDRDGDEDAILLPGGGALFIAPTPAAEPDPDNLTEGDRRRIIAAWGASRSLAAVQREVFPSYQSNGGRAFYAIKDTLVAAGLLPPYREDGNGANGYGPAPGY